MAIGDKIRGTWKNRMRSCAYLTPKMRYSIQHVKFQEADYRDDYTIVLASSSPRRLELIRTLGIEPLIIPSDVDESVDPMLTPSQVVEELASRKACSVASALPSDGENMIVIGSDTIVVQDGEILGKPQDQEMPAACCEGLPAVRIMYTAGSPASMRPPAVSSAATGERLSI